MFICVSIFPSIHSLFHSFFLLIGTNSSPFARMEESKTRDALHKVTRQHCHNFVILTLTSCWSVQVIMLLKWPIQLVLPLLCGLGPLVRLMMWISLVFKELNKLDDVTKKAISIVNKRFQDVVTYKVCQALLQSVWVNLFLFSQEKRIYSNKFRVKCDEYPDASRINQSLCLTIIGVGVPGKIEAS